MAFSQLTRRATLTLGLMALSALPFGTSGPRAGRKSQSSSNAAAKSHRTRRNRRIEPLGREGEPGP